MITYMYIVPSYFSLVMMFLPQKDSAELSYMKSQFGLVNSKLDMVLAGQDEVKAGLDILQVTNFIDPTKIHDLRDKVIRLQPILLYELRRENKLSKVSKRSLEKLIDEFKETQLESMLKSLIWSITGKLAKSIKN